MKQWTKELGLAVTRVGIGLAMAWHGFPKVFGGIESFAKTVDSMGFPMPLFFAWAAALSEFLGGLLLAAGIFTRWAAFFIFCTMTVAAFILKADASFAERELALLYWLVCIGFMLMGGGRYQLDRWWRKG